MSQELSALDLAGVEPTAHALDLTNQVRPTPPARRGRATRCCETPRTRPTAASACPRRHDRYARPLRRSAASRLLDAREVSCRELASAYLDRIDAGDAPVHAFLRTRREAALAEADRFDRDGRTGLQGVPDRAQGHPVTKGEETTAGRASSRAMCRSTTAAASRRVQGGGARHRSARRTWTSSRWARRPRTPRSASPTTRGTPTASRAARRGGSAAAVAAGFAPLCARHRHRRLDPPAGRALRRRRDEADLRRRQPLRPGRVRVVARPGRPVRAHGARLRAAAAGHLRQGRVRLDLGRAARADRAADRRAPGRPALGVPSGPARAGRRARRAASVRRVAARGRGARRARGRDHAAAHATTRCRRTTSSPRPRPRPTCRGSTASASACACAEPGDTVHDMYERTRGGRVRRRGQAPDHARHLRALGRLLRRLLRHGAEGAHAASARTSTRRSQAST